MVRLFGLVALLGLCLLPVEYRGGAVMPHAHAAFQLWWDAAHGSPDHHPWPSMVAETTASQPSAPEFQVALGGQTDTPRLSQLTPVIDFPAVLIVIPLLFWVCALRTAPGWKVALLLAGRFPSPEPPPPRVVVTTP